MNKPLILVVEDDAPIRNLITTTLKTQDYKYIAAATASEALQQATIQAPDVMLLDLGLPDLDGIEVIRRIRSWSAMPIIVISARSEDSDKLMGFACGADDYVTKPFNILELKARIRALLRRAMSGSQTAQSSRRAPLLTVGDLSLDTEQRVAIRDGRTIDLTAKEYDLIELLMKNPRRVYSRESLMDLVWGYSYAGDYRTVDVHIRRLREKLEPDPANPVYIMTKWGVGYYFTGEEQPTV